MVSQFSEKHLAPLLGEPPGSEMGLRTRLLAYLRSCAEGGAGIRRTPPLLLPRLDPGSLVLSEAERGRLAHGLVAMACVALASAHDGGDFLPAPENHSIDETWLEGLDLLRREFVAGDASEGVRARLVARLHRELLMARNARTRALRCIRLARQLDPACESAALAHAFHRSRRFGTAAGNARLEELAASGSDAKIRARAWLGLGSLALARGADRKGLAALTRAREIAPRDPETLARIAYAHLRLGDEESAGAALEAFADVAEASDPRSPGEAHEAAGTRAALGFLRSASSGFARLFAASGEPVRRLGRSHPELALVLLESVQRAPARRRSARALRPERFLGFVRRRMRVPFAALARAGETPSLFAWDSRRGYAPDPVRLEEIFAAGGPGSVMTRALEEGDAVLERLAGDGAGVARVNGAAMGAAAARVPALSLGAVFLVLESDRVLAVDPEDLLALAEEGVGPACALWLAGDRKRALRASPA